MPETHEFSLPSSEIEEARRNEPNPIIAMVGNIATATETTLHCNGNISDLADFSNYGPNMGFEETIKNTQDKQEHIFKFGNMNRKLGKRQESQMVEK